MRCFNFVFALHLLQEHFVIQIMIPLILRPLVPFWPPPGEPMTQWLGAAEWIPCVGSAVRLDSRNIHQLLSLFATRHARPACIFGDEKRTETDREERTRFISCTLFSFSNFIFIAVLTSKGAFIVQYILKHTQ